MSGIDFYFSRASAPCRSALMVAKALGVNLNKKLMNLYVGEHLKPEFLRINPQHTVPTIVDNGLTMWESQAVIMYLADKYGKTDSLYPKEPKKRALVNQRLCFDLGTFYRSFGDYYYPVVFQKQPYDPQNLKKIDTAFEALDSFLEGQVYVAGDHLTIADIALLASTSTFDVAGYDFKKYKNVTKWYEHLKKVTPGWEENWDYCQHVKGWFDPDFTVSF